MDRKRKTGADENVPYLQQQDGAGGYTEILHEHSESAG